MGSDGSVGNGNGKACHRNKAWPQGIQSSSLSSASHGSVFFGKSIIFPLYLSFFPSMIKENRSPLMTTPAPMFYESMKYCVGKCYKMIIKSWVAFIIISHSNVHSFSQSIVIEDLLCASTIAGAEDKMMTKTPNPILEALTI